jgi:hypothetical protein
MGFSRDIELQARRWSLSWIVRLESEKDVILLIKFVMQLFRVRLKDARKIGF